MEGDSSTNISKLIYIHQSAHNAFYNFSTTLTERKLTLETFWTVFEVKKVYNPSSIIAHSTLRLFRSCKYNLLLDSLVLKILFEFTINISISKFT